MTSERLDSAPQSGLLTSRLFKFTSENGMPAGDQHQDELSAGCLAGVNMRMKHKHPFLSRLGVILISKTGPKPQQS